MGNSNGMKSIVKLIVSLFYLGLIPYVPGTTASLMALLIFYFCLKYKIFLFSLICISGILGFALCGRAEEIFKEKDAKPIVIDEFFAMLLALIFVKPVLFFLILTFIIFRVVDILKFWPIKRIERLNGSLGVMLDDCMAAVYTVIIVRLTMLFL